MPLLRGRRDDGGGTKYQMREKMFAIGDDYWIETNRGERAFKVEREGASGPRHARPRTPSRDEVFTIQEKKLSVRDKMQIERDGKTAATVKKALINPLRERFSDRRRGRRGPGGEGQYRRP